MTTAGSRPAAAYLNYRWRLELEFAPHRFRGAGKLRRVERARPSGRLRRAIDKNELGRRVPKKTKGGRSPMPECCTTGRSCRRKAMRCRRTYVDLSGGLPLEGLSLAKASEPQFDLQSAATIRLSRPSVLRSTGEVLFRDEREEAPALGARSAPNRPSFATVTATRPLDARPRTAAKPSANSRPSAPTRRPPAGSARASNFAQSACPSNSPARITSDSGTSGAMAGADSLGSPGGSPFRGPCATECVAVPPLRAGRCRRLAQAGTGGC